jgi:hypothetical protein
VANKDFVVKNGIVVNTAFSANSSGIYYSGVQLANTTAANNAGNLGGQAPSYYAVNTTVYSTFAQNTSVYSTFARTDGTGASGTWGISISGTAARATNANQVDQVTPLLGYSASGQNIDYNGQGGPQFQGTGSGAAMVSFHRPGAYAINFGLGTDNQLRTGGWSRGGNYVVLDSGNYNSYAPTLGGTGASGTWGISITGSAGSATSATSAGTFTSTTQNSQFNSIGVNTGASGTAGEIRATDNITAYYSDKRLKNILHNIPDAVYKIKQLSGVVYVNNDVAKSFGYEDEYEQVGVIAQEVEKILPQIVKLAPFDTEYIDGKEVSKSGQNYKTVQYEKLIPLLIEAIKELSNKVETLEKRLGE